MRRYNYNWVDEDSFGSYLPDNWAEIAERCNKRLESLDVPEYGELTPEQRDLIAEIWEIEIRKEWRN